MQVLDVLITLGVVGPAQDRVPEVAPACAGPGVKPSFFPMARELHDARLRDEVLLVVNLLLAGLAVEAPAVAEVDPPQPWAEASLEEAGVGGARRQGRLAFTAAAVRPAGERSSA
eukprot:2105132-Pyramimonas_sp.AAC.1